MSTIINRFTILVCIWYNHRFNDMTKWWLIKYIYMNYMLTVRCWIIVNIAVNPQILWFTNAWEIQRQLKKEMMILKGVGDNINRNLFPHFFFFVQVIYVFCPLVCIDSIEVAYRLVKVCPCSCVLIWSKALSNVTYSCVLV